MRRFTAVFLTRFSQSTSIATAHPFFAAYAPKLIRDLHVFVRQDREYVEVEVGDSATAAALKKAAQAELRLDVSPTRVSLLREVEGSAPVPLDSVKKLAEQGVSEGSKVVLVVATLPHVMVSLGPSLQPTKVEFPPHFDVGDLKKAIVAELRLDVEPYRVRLLREVEGSPPIPLDSRKGLAEQGVSEGTSVLVEVMAPMAPKSPMAWALKALMAPPASTSEREGLRSVKRLYAALRAAKLEPIPSSRSSLIRLPEGVEWPQLGAVPLFVRDFYQGLYEGPLGSCDPAGKAQHRKFILVGNAGKSSFSAYVLWRAVQAGRTVVYASSRVESCFVLHSDGCVKELCLQQVCRDNELGNPSTVFICLGFKPPVAHAFTVLATPPKYERYKLLNELPDSRLLVMPVFTRSEVKDLLHTCFPALVPDKVQLVWELYRRWGGAPRHVLTKLDEKKWPLYPAGINLDDLTRNLGGRGMDTEDRASERLLHLKAEGEGEHGFSDPFAVHSYGLARAELASDYVADRVHEAMQLGGPWVQRLSEYLKREWLECTTQATVARALLSAAQRASGVGGVEASHEE